MKRFFVIFAACLVGVPAIAENITVATVNVWSGLTYTGVFRVKEYEDRATREFRFDLLGKGLTSLDPDVIAIQEANPLPAYAERLATELDMDLIYGVRQAGVRIGAVGLPTNLREGDVILAARDRAITQLPSTRLSGSGAGKVASFQFGTSSELVGGQIEVEGRAVYVFTSRWTPSPHADRDRLVDLVDSYDQGDLDGETLVDLMGLAVVGSQRRQQESRRTLVAVNEIAGEEPVILMGSFFGLPDSPEIQLLRDAGFVDVWSTVGRGPGYTFDGATNTNISNHDLASASTRERIDYIFIRGNGIAARSAAVIFSRPTFGVHPSRHFGLVAELRIDPAR